MTITYIANSTADIAGMLRIQAERLGVQIDALPPKGHQQTRNILRAEQNVWLSAGNMVRNTIIPVLDEYAAEYADAQLGAAIQIWASIQRHDGDPRWEYSLTGERLS